MLVFIYCSYLVYIVLIYFFPVKGFKAPSTSHLDFRSCRLAAENNYNLEDLPLYNNLVHYTRKANIYDNNPPSGCQYHSSRKAHKAPPLKKYSLGDVFTYRGKYEPPPPPYIKGTRCNRGRDKSLGNLLRPLRKFNNASIIINPNIISLKDRLHSLKDLNIRNILDYLPQSSILPTKGMRGILYTTAFTKACKILKRSLTDLPYEIEATELLHHGYISQHIELRSQILLRKSPNDDTFIPPAYSKDFQKPPKRVDMSAIAEKTEKELEIEKLEKRRRSLGLAPTERDIERKKQVQEQRKKREQALEELKQNYQKSREARKGPAIIKLPVEHCMPHLAHIEITNSLLLARSKASIKRLKTRMLCKQTQLKYHEAALQLMLNNDLLMGRNDIPTLQIFRMDCPAFIQLTSITPDSLKDSINWLVLTLKENSFSTRKPRPPDLKLALYEQPTHIYDGEFTVMRDFLIDCVPFLERLMNRLIFHSKLLDFLENPPQAKQTYISVKGNKPFQAPNELKTAFGDLWKE